MENVAQGHDTDRLALAVDDVDAMDLRDAQLERGSEVIGNETISVSYQDVDDVRLRRAAITPTHLTHDTPQRVRGFARNGGIHGFVLYLRRGRDKVPMMR